MPPKIKYSREDVLKAAFSIIEKEGLKNLTARSVAQSLGSSTAPVYKHFENMDSLSLAIVKKIQKMMLEYTSRKYTDKPFLNMGTGVALFACEHKGLYRALLLESDSYQDIVNEFLNILESEMRHDQRFVDLSKEEIHVLLYKMWTYTHGLASLICVGLIKSCSQQYIIDNLIEVGSDVIGSTLRKSKEKNTKKE